MKPKKYNGGGKMEEEGGQMIKVMAPSLQEAVKQIEIPVTLAVGVLFFNEREQVQTIWPGCLIIIVGLFILIFSP